VVRLEVGSDFADLFEVKNVQPKKGTIQLCQDAGGLRLSYRRETWRRDTVVSSSEPARVDDQGMTFEIRIGPYGQWATRLHVEALVQPEEMPTPQFGTSLLEYQTQLRARMREELDRWISRMPRLVCDCEALTEAYRRSLNDLAALLYSPPAWPDRLPAAGLPWFMATFGRDSILTSLQALPFAPELARSTLLLLARIQGSKLDDFREEEPGKILHEVRLGESAAFEEQPHSPYYGSVDSTPLFLVLLDEYERWTGDAELVRDLEMEARAALQWMDTYADLTGDGYLWYLCRNEQTGLENQCWKDSWNSISYRDGRIPDPPRATCETQGYAYDAKMRTARLARQLWQDLGFADELERQAADLKERFNRDFWMEEGQYYALARDAGGGHVDALSSNIGHLLWSGIVDTSRAADVTRHLLGPRLYSGWGVRTLAEGEGRYNPLGYHVGTVWPFDNSLIAWGLRNYGFHEEAARVARDMITAADYFQGRLPEAFAGYSRDQTKYPVEYPTACSPQAWSTGTPLLLLRTMLGLEPVGGRLTVAPALPDSISRIELLDIPGRWGRFNALGLR
jgi:glycogen debranching enzyme